MSYIMDYRIECDSQDTANPIEAAIASAFVGADLDETFPNNGTVYNEDAGGGHRLVRFESRWNVLSAAKAASVSIATRIAQPDITSAKAVYTRTVSAEE